MYAPKQQIVGRFLFDDDAVQHNAGRRRQILAARQTNDIAAMMAWLLAIIVATAALWGLGL